MSYRPHILIKVWPGSENVAEFFIVKGVLPRTDLSDITRILICIDGTVIDSDTQPGVIWWTDSVIDKPLEGCRTLPDGSTTYTGDVVRTKLGLASPALAEGSYDYAWVKTFEPTAPQGEVVSDNVSVVVYADCTAVAA